MWTLSITVAFSLISHRTLAGFPVAFDPSKLHNIDYLFPKEKSVVFRDPELTKGLNLSLIVPPRFILGGTADFDDRAAEYLKESVPSALQQFNVPADRVPGKVDKGTPLLINMAKQVFGAEHTPNPLQARNIFGDILGWAEDAGCALVAATGFGLYMILAGDYAANNNGGDRSSTTSEQDFFLNPSHGNLAHSAPVNIYYNAEQFPWANLPGVTFNRQVYLDTPKVGSYELGNWQSFGALVHFIRHEFTHVEQYAALGYDLTSFAHAYIFQWCKAGFSYNNIPYEVAARSREPEVDELLILGKPGNAFFWIWKYANLGPQIGNPVARSPSKPDTAQSLIELPFQAGLMQIQNPGLGNPPYRVFTREEIGLRDKAICDANAPCIENDKRSLSSLRGRSPMPPGGVPPRRCTEAEQHARTQPCRDAQAAWNQLLRNKPWKSDITVPKSAPAAGGGGSSKPGCPANCHILAPAPPTSKSCASDHAPAVCDHDEILRANEECRQRRAACA